MPRKLFIVCPFSNMEYFLQRTYGDGILFLTASGAILKYREMDYLPVIQILLHTESISSVYIVNDVSCRFINRTIQRKKTFNQLPLESCEELYMEHFFADFQQRNIPDQQRTLAELNIRRQMDHVLASAELSGLIRESGVKLSGLVTSREHKIIHEITYGNNNSTHEP